MSVAFKGLPADGTTEYSTDMVTSLATSLAR